MHFKFYFKIVVFLMVIASSSNLLAQKTVTKYYITKDGVKTPIVFDPFSLDSEKSKFLYDNSTETDRTSRYDKLKDAMGDTNTLSDLIDTIQNRSTDSGGTFSLDGAKRNIELLNKDNNRNSKTASSLEELVFLKEKYGDQPSFFINEIEVDKEVYDKVLDREILNKQIYVKNTISGNPNGERRLTVSDRALKRLNLTDGISDTPTDLISSYAFTQPALEESNTAVVENKHNSNNNNTEDLDSLLKQIKELNNGDRTSSAIEAESQKSTPSLKDLKKEKKQNPKYVAPQQEIVYSYDEINNKPKKKTEIIKTNEEEVFVVRSSDWKRTEMDNLNNKDNGGQKEEKRSIRDIKNRERSK